MTYQYSSYEPIQIGETAKTAVTKAGRRLYMDIFKRALDILIVLIAALPVLAVLIPLALLVKRDGGSPFFVQKRVGRNGQVFRMLKLRTMVVDAEERLNSYLAADPAARAEWDAYQKLRHDPRVTATGNFLRKSSLDELPQLWNVLKGDMSIVGPRPMMPSQRDIYPGTEYYELRPGITGAWQVSVRNEANFAERAQFDRRYLESLSLFTDISIILKTFRVVLRATGT